MGVWELPGGRGVRVEVLSGLLLGKSGGANTAKEQGCSNMFKPNGFIKCLNQMVLLIKSLLYGARR